MLTKKNTHYSEEVIRECQTCINFINRQGRNDMCSELDSKDNLVLKTALCDSWQTFELS